MLFWNKSNKILLVSHELSRTGAPIVLLKVASILKENNYKVDLFTYKYGELKEEFESLGIKVTEVRDDRNRFFYHLSKRSICSYKLIICNSVMTYRAVDVLQRFNVPVIWYIHESSKYLKNLVASQKDIGIILENFYNIYTVSYFAKSSISELGNPCCRVINNCVEDWFNGISKTSNIIRFGFIGTISKEKGVDVLVDAFLQLLKIKENITLTIAGKYDSEFASSLKNSVCHEKAIQWKGLVEGKTKKDFFSNIDVLCIPSNEESSSLALLEAASSGLAVIATKTVGACYIIKNKLDSIIIPSNDFDYLYNAMLYLIDNPSLIDSMKIAMRKNYLTDATFDLFKRNVLKMVSDNFSNYPIVKTPLVLEKYKLFHQMRTESGFRNYYLFEKKILSVKLKNRV